MTVTLSPKEQGLVNKYAKKEKPTYYSSDFQTKVGISPELEAFLILMPPESRSSSVEWVRNAKDVNERVTNRDDLLSECLSLEQTDSKAQLDELTKELTKYDEFRTKFYKNVVTTDTNIASKEVRFSGVPEVVMLMSDLNLNTDERVTLKDKAKHLNVLTKVITVIQNRKILSEDKKSEIKSLAGLFTAYSNSST